MSRFRRLEAVVVKERFGVILVMLLLGYLLDGSFDGVLVRLVSVVSWILLLAVALWTKGIAPGIRAVAALLSGLAIVLALIAAVTGDTDLRVAVLLLVGLIQLLALLAILVRISQHQTVGPQTVMGAVSAYFLIALSMAAFFRALDLGSGGEAFRGIVGSGDYIYFSIVTLTTLGYGDITPIAQTAKHLAGVEALVGQIFLVTLVARLVSMWGRPMEHRLGKAASGHPKTIESVEGGDL